MTKLKSFSRIAVASSGLFLLFSLVCLWVEIPFVWSDVLEILFESILIIYALLLMGQSKAHKRPATFIVIAATLNVLSTVLGVCMRYMSKENMVMMVAATGSVYLLYLIFVCLGFFKLSKQLSKRSLSRGMAIAFPCTYFVQLIANALICHRLNSGMVLLQIVLIAVFFYSLPKDIENN